MNLNSLGSRSETVTDPGHGLVEPLAFSPNSNTCFKNLLTSVQQYSRCF